MTKSGANQAATGTTRIKTQQGAELDLRLVAIAFDPQHIYRFIFATPTQQTQPLQMGLRRTTYSFREISPAEAAQYKPHRIRIHQVRPGDTMASLARQMPYQDFQVERFTTLNGLDPRQALQPGQLVKLIVEGS